VYIEQQIDIPLLLLLCMYVQLEWCMSSSVFSY